VISSARSLQARQLRNGFLGVGAWVSIGVLVALGCGGEKSETPAAAPGATAAQPAAPAAVADLWSTTLPADFPADVPTYPSSEVVKAISSPAEGVKVSWSTPDDVAKVASFFNDSLAAQGWSTQRVDGPDGTLVFGDKGARSATFGIAPGKGNTQIDLLLVEMR
jgi:hypothetical protein